MLNTISKHHYQPLLYKNQIKDLAIFEPRKNPKKIKTKSATY